MKLSFFTLAIFTLAKICLVVTPAGAEVRLASVITDHAVLQRDAPIHLWGEASPEEKITIHFHDQSVATTASHLGQWEAWLMPEPAGGPFTLTVRGSSELTRSDLLVGDVWFASGQSNMEMPLAGFPPTAHITNGAQEIAQADLPQVRLLLMERKSSDSPLDGISAAWQALHPGHGERLFCCRLLLRPRDQPARTYPHRGYRLILGRHADRFLDQSRLPLRRRFADARLRRAGPLRRHADAHGAHRIRGETRRRRGGRPAPARAFTPLAPRPIFVDPGSAL